MAIAVALLLALGLRLALRSGLRGLARLTIRGESFFVLAFLVTLAFPIAARTVQPPTGVLLLTWCAVMFAVLGLSLLNARIVKGFCVLAAGSALNLFVIAVRSAMPVSSIAARATAGAAGAAAAAHGDQFHQIMTAVTRFDILGDVLPMPGMPGLRGVVSVGDVQSSSAGTRQLAFRLAAGILLPEPKFYRLPVSLRCRRRRIV